jgi:uncharacterized protein (TIGR02996 family)
VTTEEVAMLAAICAQPDENMPRLAFADYLTEVGGPLNTAWALGIRAQVGSASGDSDPSLTQALQRAESPFLQVRILERLGLPKEMSPRDINLGGWERGFPSHMTGDYPVLREWWPRLANRVPVRHLRIKGVGDDMIADVLTWPGVGRLSTLDLTTWDGRLRDLDIGDRGLNALAACPALAGLESLTVSFVRLSDAAAAALLASLHLAGIRSLILRLRDDSGPSCAVAARLRERFGPNAID